jgi:hypothetical protein
MPFRCDGEAAIDDDLALLVRWPPAVSVDDLRPETSRLELVNQYTGQAWPLLAPTEFVDVRWPSPSGLKTTRTAIAYRLNRAGIEEIAQVLLSLRRPWPAGMSLDKLTEAIRQGVRELVSKEDGRPNPFPGPLVSWD